MPAEFSLAKRKDRRETLADFRSAPPIVLMLIAHPKATFFLNPELIPKNVRLIHL